MRYLLLRSQHGPTLRGGMIAIEERPVQKDHTRGKIEKWREADHTHESENL